MFDEFTGPHFHCASYGFNHQNARTFGRLLGPCFKTVGKGSCTYASITPLPLHFRIRSIHLPDSDESPRRGTRSQSGYEPSNTVRGRMIPPPKHSKLSAPLVPPKRNQAASKVQAQEAAADSDALQRRMFPSRVRYPWRSTMSKTFSLPFQSAFHLSFTLLVRYRTWCNI